MTMWLNDKEEKIYGPFSKYIDNHGDGKFRFIYKDGCELITEFFTEYESDNGLEPSEKGYEEYWESAFKIVKVIKDEKNIYESGKYILVNYHCVPVRYDVL